PSYLPLEIGANRRRCVHEHARPPRSVRDDPRANEGVVRGRNTAPQAETAGTRGFQRSPTRTLGTAPPRVKPRGGSCHSFSANTRIGGRGTLAPLHREATMTTVRDVMSSDLVIVGPGATVQQAASGMFSSQTGSTLVM